MKFHIVSDLHLEFDDHFVLPPTDADVIIVAGDTAPGFRLHQLFRHVRDDQHIVLIGGNHEYYGYEMEVAQAQFRAKAAGSRLHFLENEQVVIGDTRILGCTLWTDFDLYGDHESAMDVASFRLNDFNRIKYRGRMFMPADARGLHMQSRFWLEERLAEPWSGRTVVVTHHAPTEQSIPERYRGDRLSPCFASDLEYLMDGDKVQLWIHGHTHDSVDVIINGTRVVANPRGYFRDERNENPDFNPEMVIEV